MKIINNLDLNKNQLQNAVAHNLATAPANPVIGQEYFNTQEKKKYIFDGTNWVDETSQGRTYTFGAGLTESAGSVTANLATATPNMDGVGSAGSSTSMARQDHIHPSDTKKADKVSGATNGNFAGLDANGNLVDSGKKASDFLTEHQDISGLAKVDASNITASTWKSKLGLNNVTNDAQVKASEKGVANGVATLGSDGKVPSSQLPSYVDDVLEYDTKSGFPATGATGIIYVAKDTNITYRWGGSEYVEISASLALGETSSTAYAGDKGKANADAITALDTRVDGIENNNTLIMGLAGGFAGGRDANARQGGGAIGPYAVAQGSGFAGGARANTGNGGAVGFDAISTEGGAVGRNAETEQGGAVGYGALSTGGFAGGRDAKATSGGAVGYGASADAGFSGGYGAKVANNGTDEAPEYIDAIQLGSGTNNTEKSLQIYDDNIYNANTHTLTVTKAVIGGRELSQTSIVSKFVKTNPELTPSGGVCTWIIGNTLDADVIVQLQEIATDEVVMADILVTSGQIKIKIVSSTTITARTYKAVVIG